VNIEETDKTDLKKLLKRIHQLELELARIKAEKETWE
jgi:hypothetical protein